MRSIARSTYPSYKQREIECSSSPVQVKSSSQMQRNSESRRGSVTRSTITTGSGASASEFTAWRNSLSALANQLRYSGVRDHGVVLEMQLQLSSARLDAFVFGHSPAERESSVLVELKQWTTATPSDFDGCVRSTSSTTRPSSNERSCAAQRRGRRRADDGRLLLAVVRSERGRDAHRRCDDRRLPAAVECETRCAQARAGHSAGAILGDRSRRRASGWLHLHGAGFRVRARGPSFGARTSSFATARGSASHRRRETTS